MTAEIAIVILLALILLTLFRVNQYLRVIAKNQIGIGNRIADQTTIIKRGLK